MDKKSLETEIAAIGKASKTLVDRIHNCAVACLTHSMEHGEASLCLQLAEAIGHGQRQKALVFWFEHFAPIKLDIVKGSHGLIKKTHPDYHERDVDGAAKTTYFDLTKEEAPKLVAFTDMVGPIYGALKRMEEANEAGNYIALPGSDYDTDRKRVLAMINAAKVDDLDDAKDQVNILKKARKMGYTLTREVDPANSGNA
jgi:hypothetical protein